MYKMTALFQHTSQALQPTLITWMLIISGFLIYGPIHFSSRKSIY